MEDTLISYKTAVLAKEKGFKEKTSYLYTGKSEFDIPTCTHYDDNLDIDDHNTLDENWLKVLNKSYNRIKDLSLEGLRLEYSNPNILDHLNIINKTKSAIDEYITRCSAPTQSLLQRWLREIHNIHIGGEVRWNNYDRKELIYEFWIKDMREVKPSNRIHTKPSIVSYEESLEKGLYEALKLIK